MKNRLASLTNSERIAWVLWLGGSLGIIVCAFVLPGGDDLYRYYVPFENGCLDCGYVPYYAQLFLSPLWLLPKYPYAWPAWTILSVLIFTVLLYVSRSNPFLFLVSFPFLGQIWLGQIDGLICLGLLIFLKTKNPYLRGLGVILALVKPQLTFLPILAALLLERPKLIGKILLIPAAILLLSLFVYGFTWPLQWISNAMTALPVHVWRLASLDIWKFGIVMAPLPLIIKDRQKRLLAGLLVAALATPFFGVYSYVTFLFLQSTWWTLILSYVWVVGYYWLGSSALRLAWILPLVMLILLMADWWRSDRKTVTAENEMI